LRVNADTHETTMSGQRIHLTPMESELLYYLMSHAGQAVSKEDLFREVWGYEFVGGTNLVEVGVRRLREKIEKDPSRPKQILTVRGIGYCFAESVN
jgi:two-component system, OmpR family, response regulator MtrA